MNLQISTLVFLALFSAAPIAMPQSVIATVPVGSSPVWLAVNSRTNMVYVANEFDNTLSVIDGSTNKVVATVAVGNTPRFVAVNSTTNYIYVSNNMDNKVSVIDGRTNTLLLNTRVWITQDADLQQIVANPKTNHIYVINGSQNLPTNFAVIDGNTNTVKAKLLIQDNLRNSARSLAVNSTTNLIYVGTSACCTANLYVVNGATNTIVNSFSLPNPGNGFSDIAVDETNNRLYLVDGISGSLLVVDAATGTTLGTVGGFDFLVDADSFRNRAMAVAQGARNNSVFYVDTSTFQIKKTVPVGNFPWGVAINQTSRRVYVTNNEDNTVSVVSAQ